MNSPRFIESAQRSHFRWGTSAGFLLFGLGVLIANQMQQRAIVRSESRLSAAGFVAQAARTPDQQRGLELLPPHQVLQRMHGESIRYVYADPDVCECFYVGSQQSYDLYQKLRRERRLTRQRAIAAPPT